MPSLRNISLHLTAGLALAIAIHGPASARDAGPAFIQTFPGVADAPEGFIEMCARDRELCRAGLLVEPVFVAQTRGAPDAIVTGAVTDTPGSWRQQETGRQETAMPAIPAVRAAQDPASEARMIRAVNSEVNRYTMQVSDLVSAGVEERWNRVTTGRIPMGDCEDIAIEKRARLVEGGFAPDRLFYSVVYKKNFGMHTVLVARMADGDYVLDSASPHILPWAKTKYVWLRAQSTIDPMQWYRIDAHPASYVSNKKAAAPEA